jgi:PAS domain S-box-containing protein
MGERNALLITDDQDNSHQVSSIVQRAGFTVVTSSGLDRLATLRMPRPDVILLDVSPNRPLDRTAPRKLRELLRAPVILLVADADAELLRQGGVQPDAYVRKPLDDEQLCRALETALESGSLENRLTESHQQYQALFNAVPDAVFIHDKETHRFLDCNAAAVRTYGYTLDEFRRMTPFDLHPDYEHALIRQRLDVRNVDQPNPYTHLTKDGRNLNVEVRSDETVYMGRPAWVTIIRNTTGRTREPGMLDESILRQQRIESIGRLAGGVAHDFNNLLTTILGHAALALRKLPADSPCLRNLEAITQSGERASAVVSQLLAFGGRQQGKPEILDLSELVSRTTHLLAQVLGEDIELTFEVRKAAGMVLVDPVQVQQMLVNLTLNARDAMPGGGRVTCSMEPFEVTQDNVATLPGLVPGEHVRLRISDNGRGMDADTLAHAFEPFFTNKPNARSPVASGRGMGLAIAYGLVRQNRGTITVDSRPGQGTSFDIYLPCTSVESETRVLRVEQASGQKTVLVVEDEKDLCTLIHAVLTDRGYEVLMARQTEEAWEIGRRYAGPIHLLLTDAILPDGHGPELAERFRQRRPEMGVICMSGHAPDFLAQQGIKLEGLTFLPKPFKIDELARLIKDALEHPTPFRRHRPSERLQSPAI